MLPLLSFVVGSLLFDQEQEARGDKYRELAVEFERVTAQVSGAKAGNLIYMDWLRIFHFLFLVSHFCAQKKNGKISFGFVHLQQMPRHKPFSLLLCCFVFLCCGSNC